MRKILLLLLVILCTASWSQNSIEKIEPIAKGGSKFSEQDIYIDNDTIKQKTFRSNFKNNYRNTDFEYEEKTLEKNFWDRFKEWLANVFRNLFSFTNNESAMNFVGLLLKFIAIIIIGFVVYLIVKAVLNKEGKWIFGKNSDKKIIIYSDLEKNLQLVDFENLVKKTMLIGQKRLTIRYYYLWLLKKMATNEIIVWDLEKTNSDYLYEIKNQNNKNEFEYLSYLYNYIWYGEFDLDQETFDKATIAFEKAIKNLPNV